MTLPSRNKIYRAIAIFSAIFSVLLVALVSNLSATAGFHQIPESERLFGEKTAAMFFRQSTTCVLLSAFSLVFYAPVVSFFILREFEKTPAPEIKYFAFFLTSCMLEGLRVVIYVFSLWSNFTPIFFIVARALIFARLFAAICIFFVAFFSFSDRSQQTNSNLIFAAIISAIFASLLPINSARIFSSLSVSFGFSRIATCICTILYIYAAAKISLNGRENGVPRCRRLAICFCGMIFGYSILEISDCGALFFAGFFALCASTILFLKRLHLFYLWE